jgi:hypothetical protein
MGQKHLQRQRASCPFSEVGVEDISPSREMLLALEDRIKDEQIPENMLIM